MSDYIGTRILEVFECPESVADRSNGFGRVLGGINRAKLGKNWIGTLFLEVCESPESVADRCIGFERFTGVQNSAKLDWHRNPGSLRVPRKCRTPVKLLREVPICLNQG